MIIRNYKEPTGELVGTGTSTKEYLAVPDTKNKQLIDSVFKRLDEYEG
ncbi:hypothetical protein L1D56_07415 [Vibrio diabolicus]|nr:hypothetical protein [Vibrio diabolicus]MCG9619808.1 hypothetical protein [Vibrio diabolicus]